jgi:hypothetical protein
MDLLRIIKENSSVKDTNRTRSGVVWMLLDFYKRFKGVLRRFCCLEYIYTIFLFQRLIRANRGLKRVYMKTQYTRGNVQPLTIQGTPKNEKVSKIYYFYKKYWLNGFNPGFLGVCVSIFDFFNFIIPRQGRFLYIPRKKFFQKKST